MRGGDDESETKPETVKELIQMWKAKLKSLREEISGSSSPHRIMLLQKVDGMLVGVEQYTKKHDLSIAVDDDLWREYQDEISQIQQIRGLNNSSRSPGESPRS